MPPTRTRAGRSARTYDRITSDGLPSSLCLECFRNAVPETEQGRWWVRANGGFGREGSRARLGNLIVIVGQSSGAAGSVWSSAAQGSVTSFGDGTYSASFRNSDGSYSSYNSGQ